MYRTCFYQRLCLSTGLQGSWQFSSHPSGASTNWLQNAACPLLGSRSKYCFLFDAFPDHFRQRPSLPPLCSVRADTRSDLPLFLGACHGAGFMTLKTHDKAMCWTSLLHPSPTCPLGHDPLGARPSVFPLCPFSSCGTHGNCKGRFSGQRQPLGLSFSACIVLRKEGMARIKAQCIPCSLFFFFKWKRGCGHLDVVCTWNLVSYGFSLTS